MFWLSVQVGEGAGAWVGWQAVIRSNLPAPSKQTIKLKHAS